MGSEVAPRGVLRLCAGALCFVALLVAGGCACAPPVRRDVAQLFGYLPEGQSVYVSVDVANNRQLFRRLLAAQDVEGGTPGRILANTNAAAAALSFGEYNRPVIYLLADGSFPHRSAAVNLTLSRAWQRVGKRHWRHRAEGSEMTFIEPTVYAFATEGTSALADAVREERRRPIPPELESAIATADMVLYTDSVGADAVGALSKDASLPSIEWLWLALEATAETSGSADGQADSAKHYAGVGEVRFDSPRDARVASVIARLLIVRLARESEASLATALDGARVSVRDRTLVIGGLDVPGQTLLAALTSLTSRAQAESSDQSEGG